MSANDRNVNPYYEADRIALYLGDCIEVMRALPEASVDAIVTDPPYGLEFMGKAWDAPWKSGDGFRRSRNPADVERDDPFGRASRTGPEYRAGLGFQQWCEAWAREAYRVLKPGGHLIAFGGTRTHHRLVSGIEDAGFEIRDELDWMFGSGFPKSTRVDRDPRFCSCGEAGRNGAGTDHELDEDDHSGTVEPSASRNADAPSPNARRDSRTLADSRVGYPTGHDSDDGQPHPERGDGQASPLRSSDALARSHSTALGDDLEAPAPSRIRSELYSDRPSSLDSPIPASFETAIASGNPSNKEQSPRTGSGSGSLAADTQNTGEILSAWPHCNTCGKPVAKGHGSALKPAHEPICLARKPLIGTLADNVLAHGTGALNIDGTRIGTTDILNGGAYSPESEAGHIRRWEGGEFARRPGQYTQPAGRWPANVMLDERWTPVLRLRDNLSSDAWLLLEEWCRERSREVPPMSSRDRRTAEPQDEEAILLTRLLRPVDEREQSGGGASDDGAQAHARIHRENAGFAGEEHQARRGERAVEGRGVPQQGLPDALDGLALTGRVNDGGSDAPEGQGLPAGASPRHGDAHRAAAPIERGGAPLQRYQDGQPHREPRTAQRRDAQAGAQANREGVTGAASRERTTARRTVEVLMRDVPDDWIARYFEPTGHVARVGAAALLDAQAGERRSAGLYPNGGAAAGDGWGMTAQGTLYGDRGGPSRFFYTAKASRSEREAGLEDLPPALRTDGREPGGPGGENPRLRVSERRNDHPTVKPISVMRWLCRLVMPPGGVILDPFLGSGTTALAALDEGFRFIGIDTTERYVEIARYRVTHRHFLDEPQAKPPTDDRLQGRLL